MPVALTIRVDPPMSALPPTAVASQTAPPPSFPVAYRILPPRLTAAALTILTAADQMMAPHPRFPAAYRILLPRPTAVGQMIPAE